jgi:hypothetical protein
MARTYSQEFCTTLATIAAKARGGSRAWTTEQCVNFAWFSVNEPGDAAEDDQDFVAHIAAFKAEGGLQ